MSEKDQLPQPAVIVVGGGGHAKVLIGTLLLQDRAVLGFVDLNRSRPPVLGIANLGDDSVVLDYASDKVHLVNGVGSIDSTARHREVFEGFIEKRYVFENVIHPSAVVSLDVHLGEGSQIMAGAVLQPGIRLGDNVIVNTGARVDHDCRIDSHAHIAPGATLSGHIHIGSGAHIGTGATIIQGVTIGAGCIVGAGAVVIDDVLDGITVVGVPARPVKARNLNQESKLI
jgi:UDP-perosamine 4-acetyltransferase